VFVQTVENGLDDAPQIAKVPVGNHAQHDGFLGERLAIDGFVNDGEFVKISLWISGVLVVFFDGQ